MKKILFMILPLLLLQGCGYQIGSMTVGGISTVSIAPVINETGKSFIEESIITNKLNQFITRDGSIKVVSPELADAEVHIKLTNYVQAAQAFSDNDVGTHFRLILTAQVNVNSNEDQRGLFSSAIEGEATYEASLDQSEIERITMSEAIEDLCLEIVRNLVEGGW